LSSRLKTRGNSAEAACTSQTCCSRHSAQQPKRPCRPH